LLVCWGVGQGRHYYLCKPAATCATYVKKEKFSGNGKICLSAHNLRQGYSRRPPDCLLLLFIVVVVVVVVVVLVLPVSGSAVI
jgi:hypothetical protein